MLEHVIRVLPRIPVIFVMLPALMLVHLTERVHLPPMMVMHNEAPQNLMRMAGRKKQRQCKQEKSISAHESHPRLRSVVWPPQSVKEGESLPK